MDERSTCETDDIRWDQFPDAAQWRSDKIIAQVETRTGTPPPTPYHFALLVMRDIYRALQPHVRYFEQSSLNPQFFEDAMNTGLRAIAYFSWHCDTKVFLTRRVYPTYFDFLTYSHVPEG